MLRNAGAGLFEEADVAFMSRLLEKSGTGEATAWPPGILRCRRRGEAQDKSMAAARAEAEAVICGSLAALFEKTGVRPKEVSSFLVHAMTPIHDDQDHCTVYMIHEVDSLALICSSTPSYMC